MDISIITTQHDVEMANELSHTYMVLQWLCREDPQYKGHWCNIKREFDDAYVILDNGANEGKLCSGMELINTAYDILADEIICPDVYKDANKTVEKTKEFLNEYYEKYLNNKINVMAVLQGNTEQSFMDCYNAFLDDNRIGIIGVGYRNLMEAFKPQIDKFDWDSVNINNHYLKDNLNEDCYYYTLSRLYFLKNKVNYKTIKEKGKHFHLLGLYNPAELGFYKRVLQDNMSFIRGNDSACLSQAAQAKVRFNKSFGVYNKPKTLLNFDKRLSSSEKIIFNENLNILREWLRF